MDGYMGFEEHGLIKGTWQHEERQAAILDGSGQIRNFADFLALHVGIDPDGKAGKENRDV
jgi:hypothetical protein